MTLTNSVTYSIYDMMKLSHLRRPHTDYTCGYISVCGMQCVDSSVNLEWRIF